MGISPAGFTSSSQNPVVTATAGTNYQVTAAVAGCSTTDSAKPVVKGSAQAAFGTIPVRAVGATNLDITFSIAGGTASHYAISGDTAGRLLPGFAGFGYTALPSPVNGVYTLPVPVSAAPAGTYDFWLGLKDQTSGCETSINSFSVQIADGTNNLSNLTIDGAFLYNRFNSGVVNYTAVTATPGTNIVNVTPVLEDSRATLAINGVPAVSGAPVGIPVQTGDNIITIQVKATTGAVKTYTLTVARAANTSVGTLAPFPFVVYLLRSAYNGNGSVYSHTAITPPATVAGFTNAAYPLIRVRRSTDNAMLDIGPLGSGYLDTVTLKKFTGEGDGFVAIWYDQSSLSHDAVQTTAGSQPRIVKAGIVERKNSQPAVYFYGTDNNNVFMASESFTAFNDGFTLFAAAGVKTNNSGNALVTKTVANFPGPWDIYSNSYYLGNSPNLTTATMSTPFAAATPFGIWSFYGSTAGAKSFFNGNALTSANSARYADGGAPVVLGSRNDGNNRLDGWISETLIYPYVLTDSVRGVLTAFEKAFYVQPAITVFTPVRGTGGTTVTITGRNFTGASMVSFGGIKVATFTVVNENTITANVPAGAVSGNIAVTTPAGTAAKGGFTYGPPPGNALNFNGTSNNVILPTALINNLSRGTYETWVYLTDNTKGTILAKQANGVATNSVLSVGYSAGSGGNYTAGTAGKVYFRSQNTSPLLTSKSVLSNGHWYHIALAFGGTDATLYVNGVKDTTMPGNFSIPNLQTTATVLPALGAWLGDGGGNYLKGSLDEVRIFNTVRTADQV